MGVYMDTRKIIEISLPQAKLEELYLKGVFIVPGAIDMSSSVTLTMDLLYYSFFNPAFPIWIVLNSPGGSIIQGLAMYDTIRALVESGREINIVGMGDVASMAVCIMQAGTKRYSLPNTQFIIHQASVHGSSDSEEVNNLAERTKEIQRQNDIVLNIIAERSGISMKRLKTISNKTDLAYNAVDAKAFGSHGLIDEILTSFPFLPKD
jgi:ATP-dependent Clp protease protease subunit